MKLTVDPRAAEFVSILSSVRLTDVFNPYAEVCMIHDRPDGPRRRRQNLKAVLTTSLLVGVDVRMVARDLGYRGGRRTGLALTDEAHLGTLQRIMKTPELKRATKGPPISERTASVVWQVIAKINRPMFLWNVLPFHPHEPDNPMSNRLHTRRERKIGEVFIGHLVELLRPEVVIALGRDSQASLDGLGIPATYVRHPSYGGQGEFTSAMFSLFE